MRIAWQSLQSRWNEFNRLKELNYNVENFLKAAETRGSVKAELESLNPKRMGNGDIDARYIDIREQTFSDVDFSDLNLEGAKFDRCEFERCQFNGVALCHAHFSSCSFISCSFQHANLFNAVFSGGRIAESSFDHAVLARVRFVDFDINDPVGFLSLVPSFSQHKLPTVNKYLVRTKSSPNFFDKLKAYSAHFLGRMHQRFAYVEMVMEEREGDYLSAQRIYDQIFFVLKNRGRTRESESFRKFRSRSTSRGFIDSLSSSLKSAGLWLIKSPFNILICALFINLVFSAIYYYLGQYFNIEKYDADGGVYSRSLGFGEALYYSIVTFTTLGYGDISPDIETISECGSSCKIFLLLPALQSILGALTISLVSVSIIRKLIFD